MVLGKPGSGCSTFLRAITNQRGGFADVQGTVHYGGIPSDAALKHYRAEIVYSEEDDIHFPLLTVSQTLCFALLNKVRRRELLLAREVMAVMGRVFGIGKVFDTIVGNGFIRGVSGGERKRVSIVETLATAATVTAWDNSTRGLDASTAVEYVKSLRIITDTMKRTTFVTLYQAGEGIYNLMDKILLIDEGRMIYCGPANVAKAYFIDLGFECPPRQTTADFLTAITDPVERRFRPGWENRTPKTPRNLNGRLKRQICIPIFSRKSLLLRRSCRNQSWQTHELLKTRLRIRNPRRCREVRITRFRSFDRFLRARGVNGGFSRGI